MVVFIILDMFPIYWIRVFVSCLSTEDVELFGIKYVCQADKNTKTALALTHCSQEPFPLKILSITIYDLFYFHVNFDALITLKFCIYHDSCAVLAWVILSVFNILPRHK